MVVEKRGTPLEIAQEFTRRTLVPPTLEGVWVLLSEVPSDARVGGKLEVGGKTFLLYYHSYHARMAIGVETNE